MTGVQTCALPIYERQKSLNKIDSFSNVQNVMVNEILSYIDVICHNKTVYYNTETNKSSPHHMFKLPHIKTATWERGEQISKNRETMLLSYSIKIKDDVDPMQCIMYNNWSLRTILDING